MKFHTNTAKSFLGKCVNVHLISGDVYPSVLFKSIVRCGGSGSIHSWDLEFCVKNTGKIIIVGIEKIHFLEKVSVIGE